MNQNRYVIARGPDGTYWVTLQPLLHDIIEQLNAAQDNQVTKHSLEVVRTFISALISEANFEEFANKQEDNEVTYSQSLQ
jgi:hypothetical protein